MPLVIAIMVKMELSILLARQTLQMTRLFTLIQAATSEQHFTFLTQLCIPKIRQLIQYWVSLALCIISLIKINLLSLSMEGLVVMLRLLKMEV